MKEFPAFVNSLLGPMVLNMISSTGHGSYNELGKDGLVVGAYAHGSPRFSETRHRGTSRPRGPRKDEARDPDWRHGKTFTVTDDHFLRQSRTARRLHTARRVI